MSMTERQKLFTRNIAKLISYAYDNGFELALNEVARPIEMQKLYVQTGRSKTMQSRHLDKLAADFVIWKNGKMMFPPNQTNDEYLREIEIARPLGEYWESLHADNVWGGDWNRNGIMDERFRDPYHFEIKPPSKY